MNIAEKIKNGIKNDVKQELDGTYMARDYRMSKRFRDCLIGAMGFKICMILVTAVVCAANYFLVCKNMDYIKPVRREAYLCAFFMFLGFTVYMWADWVRTLICRAVSCKRKRKATIIELVFIVVLAPVSLLKPLIWVVPVLFTVNTIIEIIVLARKPEPAKTEADPVEKELEDMITEEEKA